MFILILFYHLTQRAVSYFELHDVGKYFLIRIFLLEISKLIEQYLVRLDDNEGCIWACTACDKRSRVKHHVREHIEVNHIDCLTFTCPYCKSEQKNRVSFRSHISKRHREEHKINTINSKQLALQY